MNAFMNITVRVQAQQALSQLNAVTAATNAAKNAGRGGGGDFLGGLLNQNKKLQDFGKDVQWTGRQLLYNFTIPLGIAGAAAFKFAMDNERAMVQVKKVYGDFTFTAQRVREETDILSRSFELLSSRYGVLQKDVIEIGAAWAGAGASGRSLQEATKSTLELMILGEMDAVEATQALIGITATWRFSMKETNGEVSELHQVLSDLNAIENQTAIRFADLVTVTEKAGGTARIAGMDFQHLAAMAAALVPATGSAAQAGNALKTIISRLQAPTKDVVDILGKMGIDALSKDWMGKDVTDKIETLAASFEELSTAQQSAVASFIGSRWQVTKFSQLMLDISSGTGYYARALGAVSDKTKTQELYQKELMAVLDSSPRKFDILMQTIKNGLATAIIPLLPAIMGVVSAIARMVQGFTELDPGTQKTILMWLTILALTGPVIQYLGAVSLLLSQVFKLTLHIAQGAIWMGKGLIAAGTKIVQFFGNVVLEALWAIAGWVDSAWAAIFGGQTTAATASASATTQAAQQAATGSVTAARTAATAQGQAAQAASAAWLASYSSIASGAAGAAETEAAAAQAMAFIEAEAAQQAKANWLTTYASIASGAAGQAESTAAFFEQTKATMAAADAKFRAATQAAREADVLAEVEAETEKAQFWASTRQSMAAADAKFRAATQAAREAEVLAEVEAEASKAQFWAETRQAMAAADAKFEAATQAAREAEVLAEVQAETEKAQFWASTREAMAAADAKFRAATQAAREAEVLAEVEAEASKAAFWSETRATMAAADAKFRAATESANAAAAAARYTEITGTTIAEVDASIAATNAWIASYTAIGTAATGAAGAQTAAAGTAASANVAAASTSSAGVIASFRAVGAAMVGLLLAPFKMVFGLIWAMIGPLVAPILSALATLGSAIAAAVVAIAGALGLPVWAVVAIIVAAIALIVALFNDDFRNGIINAIKSVAKFAWSGVKAISDAFVWLMHAIVSIMQTIWEALSRLNPFQRHSPSLVDNVTAGVAAILSEYSKLRAIPGMMAAADRALQSFGKATAGASRNFELADRAQTRATIVKAAPGAGPSVDAMFGSIDRLKASLVPLQAEIVKQEAIVNRWKVALDKADERLRIENNTLRIMQYELDQVGDRLNEARGLIEKYSSAGITGMRAMDDAIFANEMAQKRLRLEMLRLSETSGNLDDIKSKMASIAGEIERLRAEQSSLRDAGAGSDITSLYDEQIAALEAQNTGLEGSASQLDELQKKLEELQREGEILDLERSINFDPQLRQIDQLVTGLNELPFDEIMQKIREQQEEVARLQPVYDGINAKVERQQQLVDQLQFARDGIAFQLDTEQNKLDKLNSIYQSITDQIREMESAMEGFASSAERAAAAADAAEQSLAQQLFDAGAGSNYDIPGGDAALSPDAYNLPSMEEFNAQLQAELDKALSGMDDFDIFKPIKDAWNATWGFIKRSAGTIWHGIHAVLVRPIAATIGWIGRNFSLEGIKNAWNTATDAMAGAWEAFSGFIANIWNTYIYPALAAVGNFLWTVLGPAFSFIGTIATAVWNGITTVIGIAWGIIQPILQGLYDFFMGYIFPIFQLFYAVVKIVLTLVARLFMWAWETVIAPVFGWLVDNLWKIVPAALMLLWGAMQFVWKAITGIISWAWNTVIKPIFDAVNWVIKNVLGPVFSWLLDKIIRPVWDAIGKAVKWAWDNLVKPAFDAIGTGISTMATAFVWLKDNIVKPVWNGIASIIGGVINGLTGTLEGGVNGFIKAFNFLARGVKAVASALSIDVSINEMQEVDIPQVTIPKLAAGGNIPHVQVNDGFVTQGARAIVGEGNPAYPEYVIPTDPKYRNRAFHLARLLLEDLTRGRGTGYKADGHGQFMYGIGGILPSPGDVVNAIGDGINSLKDGAIKLVWDPIKGLAEGAIERIPLEIAQKMAQSALDKVDNWVTDSDANLNTALAEAIEKAIGSIKHNPGVNMNLNRDFLERYAKYNMSVGSPFTVISGLRTRAQQEALYAAYLAGTGNLAAKPGTSRHESGYALDHAPGTGFLQKYMDAAREHGLHYPVRSPQAEDWHIEPIVRAAQGAILNHGGRVGGFNMPLVAAQMGRGGRIPAVPGGTLLHVAEQGRAEEVQVLPLNDNDKNGKGERHIHFHGNLEFPNVRTAEDAEDFLDNLERLAD